MRTDYRAKLGGRLGREQGSAVLHDMLKEADPKAAGQIHANNRETGDPGSGILTKKPESKFRNTTKKSGRKTSPYNFAYFVLNDDREIQVV